MSGDNGWLLPDDLEPTDTLCVSLEIPNDELYRAAFVGAVYQLQYWFNWQRTGDDSGQIASQLWRNLITETLTISDGPCEPPQPTPNQPGSGNGASGGYTLDDLINILEYFEVKFRLDGKLYNPVIDLVEDCGCSGTGGAAGGGNVTAPGATSGNAYSGDVPTLCDLISGGWPEYVSARVDDNIGLIQNGLFFADTLLSLVDAPLARSWVDTIRGNASEITGQLLDPTWLNSVKTTMAKIYNDPVSPPFTRNDLIELAGKLPYLSEGAPMGAAYFVWAYTANLSEINSNLPAYVGSGDLNDCAPYFLVAGREPYTGGGSGDNGQSQFNFTAANSTEYTVLFFELNEPYSYSTKPTQFNDLTFNNISMVGGGSGCSHVDTLSGFNSDNIFRITDESNNLIWNDTMPLSSSEYDGHNFVGGEFTAQDKIDILNSISVIYPGFNSTEDGTATLRSFSGPTLGQTIRYGSTRGAQPVGTCETRYVWVIYKANP